LRKVKVQANEALAFKADSLACVGVGVKLVGGLDYVHLRGAQHVNIHTHIFRTEGSESYTL
jgi:hypothetical protein